MENLKDLIKKAVQAEIQSAVKQAVNELIGGIASSVEKEKTASDYRVENKRPFRKRYDSLHKKWTKQDEDYLLNHWIPGLKKDAIRSQKRMVRDLHRTKKSLQLRYGILKKRGEQSNGNQG